MGIMIYILSKKEDAWSWYHILMKTTAVAGMFGNARQFRTPGDRIDMPETPAMDIDGPLSIPRNYRRGTGILKSFELKRN